MMFGATFDFCRGILRSLKVEGIPLPVVLGVFHRTGKSLVLQRH